MHYTVATLKDVHGDFTVDFDKCGNEYVIGISSEERDEYVTKHYSTLEEAYSVFEKLSKAVITGTYSYEDRKAML